MKMLAGIALALAAAAFAAGCATTTQNGREVGGADAAKINVELGVEYMRRGDLALAKEKLDRAEKQDPNSTDLPWARASLAERLNQPEEAERYYQQALKSTPANSGLANTYAVFLCRNGKVDKALPLFDGVIRDRLYPTPWAAATNAAICLRSDKRNGDAVPYLERALGMRPDFVSAVVELADLQIVALNKPTEARGTVDRFLQIGRKSADVLLVGVRASLAEGNRSAADNYARMLRRDYPNSPQAQSLAQLMNGARPAP